MQCFHCHEVGHYATNCPQKKSEKASSKGSDGEGLASYFELDFCLITCMVSSMVGYVWYLDSGASFHMTSDKNLFSTLEEKDLQMWIEMGDDGNHVSGDCPHTNKESPLWLSIFFHIISSVSKDETISSNCKAVALLPIAITILSHESSRERNKLMHLSSSEILISIDAN